jgi:hypothetical protein
LKNNTIFYDVKLWGGNGKPPVEIKDNRFTVRIPTWDRNFSSNAFEVVDQNGRVVLQMIRKSPNSFSIAGIFGGPTGELIAAGDEGILQNPSSEQLANFLLKPIFKYPSWKYQGQYSD